MPRLLPLAFPVILLALILSGCRRPPANVFPGTSPYEERVAKLKINPVEAYEIALKQAKTDNRVQFVSRRPTVLVKNWYVFSLPQDSGASLQGYHVNGNTGEVKYMGEKKSVGPNRN
ncbi:MAG: hypothetical protein LBE84_10095 [Planctomycetota bacterium]|jgi:hypothetical protein|nr:hypothetical protein [Planctomycetota bacterium]